MKSILIALLSVSLLSLHAAENDTVTINLINADVKEAVTLYERLTGFQTISNGPGLVGLISLSIPEPGVSKPKAIELLEQAFFASSINLVQKSPEIIRLFPPGTNPKLDGLPIFTKAEDLPTSERVLAYRYKLNHRNASEIADQISCGVLVPNPGGFTTIIPDEGTGTLFMVEKTSTMRYILQFLESADLPVTKAVERSAVPSPCADPKEKCEPQERRRRVREGVKIMTVPASASQEVSGMFITENR